MVINIQDKQSQHKSMSAWDDILMIDDQLSSEEKILKSSVRSYCQENLLPRIIDDNRNENFSKEIFSEMGELGILGSYLHGYGCAGTNYVSYGLIAREIENIDSAYSCLLYTSPSPRDRQKSRMPSSA